MAAVAVPVYASPMTVIVQVAAMFQHGNSVGAAFTLLVLGAGVNLGLLAWMSRNYGLGRTAGLLAVLVVTVLALAYAVDKPLFPEGVDAAGHTHAFDVYCQPFHGGEPNVGKMVVGRIRRDESIGNGLNLWIVADNLRKGAATNAIQIRRSAD